MSKKDLERLMGYLKPIFDDIFPEGWFLTGSSYLVQNGYLNRSIHDIDIMTKADHYHEYHESDKYRMFKLLEYPYKSTSVPSSAKFIDDEGNEILIFKLYYGMYTIDVMFNPSATEDNIADQIIKYKAQKACDRSDPDQAVKHSNDLMYMLCNDYLTDEIKKHLKRYLI